MGPQPSGRFDVEDRLEINNVIGLYAHTIDHGMVDEWVALFTPDAVFEMRYPGTPQMTATGHGQIRPLAIGAKAMLDSGRQRRHRLGNIIFHEQTSTRASISCYLLLSTTTDQRDLALEFSGQYDGLLIKDDAVWKISRWTLISDSALEMPTVPE